MGIASRHERVMDAGGGVFHELHDRPATVGVQRIACLQEDSCERCTKMLHGKELVQVCRVERPEIHDLVAVSVDDLDGLSLAQSCCRALPCRDFFQVICHLYVFPLFPPYRCQVSRGRVYRAS